MRKTKTIYTEILSAFATRRLFILEKNPASCQAFVSCWLFGGRGDPYYTLIQLLQGKI
ncbi:hypothetical protein CHCC5022_3436 [Bacillus paralicheniformis]|nr:hypothetical protein CHCC5022_3436 [Bacillus paralicheniformis]TWJ76037.1 hypothetical protein CHCC4186_1211 [Bacillus paralicheniformis]